MNKTARITVSFLICCMLLAMAGCSKISRIKESISGDEFTEKAGDYGLEVEKKEASSVTTYIAKGNDIYVEFYVFANNSYISTSYDYITSNIEDVFSDSSAKAEENDGEYPRFSMKDSTLNATASVIGNTMVYIYSTSASEIDNVDEFMEKIGY